MLVTSQGTVSLSSSFPRFLSTTKKIFHTAFSLQPGLPWCQALQEQVQKNAGEGPRVDPVDLPCFNL